MDWRALDDMGWREVGWGIFLGGAILLVISTVLGATVGIVASTRIAIGGLLGAAYPAIHSD